MKRAVIVILVLSLFLLGCASQKVPEIVCKSPYMRHGDSCCLDKNSNDICDDDEEEDVFFVEPDYGDSPFEEVPDAIMTYDEPAEEVDDEPILEEFVLPEPVKKSYTTYYSPDPEMVGWEASDEFMSIEINKIVLEVNSIEPVIRNGPDKEVILKEIYLTIKNFDYNYLNPVLYFRVGDWKDPIIIKETLMCDRGDDILMEGCKNALPIAESMQVKMHVDRKIPRIDIEKEIFFSFQNKRINLEDRKLEIKKDVDILKISGATYK